MPSSRRQICATAAAFPVVTATSDETAEASA